MGRRATVCADAASLPASSSLSHSPSLSCHTPSGGLGLRIGIGTLTRPPPPPPPPGGGGGRSESLRVLPASRPPRPATTWCVGRGNARPPCTPQGPWVPWAADTPPAPTPPSPPSTPNPPPSPIPNHLPYSYPLPFSPTPSPYPSLPCPCPLPYPYPSRSDSKRPQSLTGRFKSAVRRPDGLAATRSVRQGRRRRRRRRWRVYRASVALLSWPSPSPYRMTMALLKAAMATARR